MTTSASLSLKTVFNTTNPALQPLRDGSVTIEGVEMLQQEVPNIIVAFRRMCRTLVYDISEMAVVTYFAARHYGLPMTAIPVMASVRVDQGQGIFYNEKTGVKTPLDLEGRKVGMRAYTVTPATWQRAYLKQQGVDLAKVQWLSATEEHVEAYHKDKVPNLEYRLGADLDEMLATGEIAAAFLNRIENNADIKPFFPDSRERGIELYNREGVLQLVHLIVVKNSVLEQSPWVLRAAYDAFKESKRVWLGQREGEAPAEYDDPLPLGLRKLRPSLERLMQYTVEQGIIPRALDLDEIFPGGFD